MVDIHLSEKDILIGEMIGGDIFHSLLNDRLDYILYKTVIPGKWLSECQMGTKDNVIL